MAERNPASPSPSNFPYVIAVLVMSALGVIAVVMITLLRPTEDNTVLIASVLGFLLPTTMALLAFMKSQETHLMVNGRMDAFIAAAESAARAKGIEEGMRAAEERSDVIADRVEVARDKTL